MNRFGSRGASELPRERRVWEGRSLCAVGLGGMWREPEGEEPEWTEPGCFGGAGKKGGLRDCDPAWEGLTC